MCGRKQYEQASGTRLFRVYDPTDYITLLVDQEVKDRDGNAAVLQGTGPAGVEKNLA